jgi:hypothetical protein
MKKWLEQSVKFLSQSQVNEKKYLYQFSIEEPDSIDEWVIYIVGERANYWMITFKCPCGCDSVISLNLLKGVRPRWKFKTRWGTISISPSVWRRVGCRSHFYIRKGRVDWSDIKDWS